MREQAPLQQRLNRDKTLRFAKDGTFQITVFSDLHYAEEENSINGPLKDKRSGDVVWKVLGYEHTELVVINGDLISGYGTTSNNASDYVDQVVAPIVEKDLLWASTYGNHDNEYYIHSEDVLKKEQSYPNSLTQKMVSHPSAGVSNYYLPVYPASESQDIPELILWFFDSRGGREADYVHDSVATWFTEKNANLTDHYKKTIPSLAFFHIPVNASRAFREYGVSPCREPGINGEPVSEQDSSDYHGRDVPFMRALLNTTGLLATFSGHDHLNDWCFKWNGTIQGKTLPGNGMNLCYGRHSGYGGYGDVARGGRQILLKQDSLQDEVATWIRLEDGWVTGNVTLNSTYGQDEYYPRSHKKCDQVENRGSNLSAEINSILLFSFLIAYLPLRLWNR